jgi:hypothetical protein
MRNIIGFIILVSTLFSQEQYCYTEEEVIELQQYIEECEFKQEFCFDIENALSSQVKDLQSLDSLNKDLIQELETQLVLKDDLIKEVKPKWHENKYLWFGYGIVAIILPTWVLGNVK